MRIKTVFLFSIIGLLTACSDNTLSIFNGETKSLKDYRGQWLFINYWAAWCKPCLIEIPELNAFNLKSDVTVLAYNYDHLEKEALAEQIREFDIQYESILNDPAAIFSQEKPRALPATMVVNQKGEFIEWLYGPQNQQSLLTKLN